MRKYFALFLIFFLSACAIKSTQTKTQTVHFTLLSPEIKIADAGFLKQNKQEIKLELYKLAHLILKLKIDKKICANQACYPKLAFNAKYFKNYYYEDFLSDILLAKPLFNGKNLEKTRCGFKQKINSQNYEIEYEICDLKISFYEKKNKIKIILKRIN